MNSATLRIRKILSSSVLCSQVMSASGSNLFTSQTKISATKGKFGVRKFAMDINLGYPSILIVSVKSVEYRTKLFIIDSLLIFFFYLVYCNIYMRIDDRKYVFV